MAIYKLSQGLRRQKRHVSRQDQQCSCSCRKGRLRSEKGVRSAELWFLNHTPQSRLSRKVTRAGRQPYARRRPSLIEA